VTSRGEYLVAIAVTGGFGALAVVTHFGLLRIADAVEGAARVREGAVASSQSATPQAQRRSSEPPAELLAEDRKIRTREQAMSALALQRGEYAAACWRPKPGIAELGVGFNVTLAFDASGRETTRRFEPEGSNAPAYLDCVRQRHLSPLRIPPPGEPVETTFTLIIP
jgi:hypothetical protein